jgi:hypothetical protein
VTDELEEIWKEATWPNYGALLTFALEGLRKTTKKSQDIQCPGQDLDQAPPKYTPRELLLDKPTQHSDIHEYIYIYKICNTILLMQHFTDD